MTHTPGPWVYVRYSNPPTGDGSVGFITGSTADNTYTIAEVSDHGGDVDNGPMLATSPEMLDTLELVAQHFRHIESRWLTELEVKVLDVIAKSKGEAT